jgi:hypothetical protein
MSGYTGTQMELLYAMPANGTAVTAAAATVLTGTPAASNPPYQLPSYFFPAGQGGPGKTLVIRAGGFFSTGTLTSLTDIITVGFDTAAGTLGITLAKTGAITGTTLTSITNGAWYLDVTCTCQQVGSTTNLISAGTLSIGAGNNAATTGAATYMVGTPNTPVVIVNSTAYFIEVFNTWSVTTGAPTITCNLFTIFGCN